jgi:hypothetical protein
MELCKTGVMSDMMSGSESAGDVSCGSWLRDNVLTQPATARDPVNVV